MRASARYGLGKESSNCSGRRSGRRQGAEGNHSQRWRGISG